MVLWLLTITKTSNFSLSQSIGDCVLILVSDGDVYLGYLEFIDQALVILALEHKEWFALIVRELPSRSLVISVSENTSYFLPIALTVASLAAHRDATYWAWYS